MVPLISQVRYGACCRYCGTRFSWRYFWVELLTAVVFTVVYVRYGVLPLTPHGDVARTCSTLAAMAFVSALIVVFFIDLEHFSIHDATLWVAAVAAVARDLLLIRTGDRSLWQSLPGLPEEWRVPIPLSILTGVVAFWLLWQFAALGSAALGKEAMGAGDPLLLGTMGAFLLPWPVLAVAFLVAVFLGAVGGVIGIWWAGRQEDAAAAAAAREAGTAGTGTEEAPENPAGATHAAEAVEPGAPHEPTETVEPTETAEPVDSHAQVEQPEGAEASASAEPADPTDAADSQNSTEPAPGEDEPAVEGGADPAGLEQETGDGGLEFEGGLPLLPPDSRWGRLLTVAGIWAALIALWVGAIAVSQGTPGVGAGIMAAGLAVGAGLVIPGVRRWRAGDGPWKPVMNERFEEHHGPGSIPFGPYLVAGTFIAMLFGRQLVELYAVRIMGLSSELLRGLDWE
jgi:prepilin signal peptidase PulO-like enzyme (type II secretory pathway)